MKPLGGRVYYVGGCVRDALLGRTSKDVDVEVHGVAPQMLEKVLASLGEPKEVGASFGVYNLRGHTLDVALPRAEGSRNVDDVDPFVGTLAAARRRDLTMNALYEDVLTGEVIDHFGGRDDLARGVLRHVDAATFVEDPLRVLRVAQFAARLDMRPARSTVELCAGIDVGGVAAERVLEELRKVLLKAACPSIFFAVLRDMRQLEPWFAEAAGLVGVPQNPTYHPEGDAWAHTMLVLDEAAKVREQASDAFSFMLAALCHDFGKAQTTREVDGRLVSYGHEGVGVELARTFLRRLGASKAARAYVCNMVELHMRPNAMVSQGARQKRYNHLFDRSVCPRDLLLLAHADDLGRGRPEGAQGVADADDLGRGRPGDASNVGVGVHDPAQAAAELQEHLRAFEDLMARPYVQGRDLIEAGVAPGPALGEALAYAHKLRLAGLSKDDQLRQSLASCRK